ncbi:MAG: hypothetical protein R6V77_06875 [Candidatus Cloacimonadaceae bacterium]
MKKYVLIAMLTCLAIWLIAQEPQSMSGMLKSVPRIYTQLLVNDSDGGELPGVMNNDAKTTAEDYTYTAYITSRPHEVMSTDSTLANVPSPIPYIRVFRLGNGTSFPFVTMANVQLAGFTTNWAAGDTVRLELTHKPSGEKVSWELVIPDDNTYAIGYKQKHNPIEQIVAPPFSRKE